MALFDYNSVYNPKGDIYDPAKPDYSKAPGTGWDYSTLKWNVPNPYKPAESTTSADTNKFTPVKNEKSPELTKLATDANKDLDKTRENLNKSFSDWLAEFKATSATNKGLLDQSRQQMEQDRAALNTDDFASRLADIRSRINAGIGEGRDLAVSNLNRNMKLSALQGVYGGASGELADKALRAYNDINAGTQLKLNEGQREDARLLEELRQRNIGRGTGLTRDYMAMLNAYQDSQRSPFEMQARLAQTLSPLTSEQIRRNLETNFYGLKAPIQQNTPATPFFSAGQPNFRVGGYDMPRFSQPSQQQRFVPETVGVVQETPEVVFMRKTGRRPSKTELDYFVQTGFVPTQDPLFNPYLYENLGGTIGTRPSIGDDRWNDANLDLTAEGEYVPTSRY